VAGVRKNRPARDPLEPIRTAVASLLILTVGGFVVAFLSGFVSVHTELFGGGPVCISGDQVGLVWKSGHIPVDPAIDGLARGVQATAGNVIFCANSPDLPLRLAGLLATWPTAILWLVFLLRLHSLLRAAARPGGLYSPVTAARLHALGWIMTAGAIAVAVLQSAANTIIAARLIPEPVEYFSHLTLPYITFFLGLTLLTIARVMRLGAAMREELDVTV
jgi:hypothetical protein